MLQLSPNARDGMQWPKGNHNQQLLLPTCPTSQNMNITHNIGKEVAYKYYKDEGFGSFPKKMIIRHQLNQRWLPCS